VLQNLDPAHPYLAERGLIPDTFWVQRHKEVLRLVTHLGSEKLSTGEVALLCKERWRIELFFRWRKCTLGCRHWLAESPQGVALQIYLALIAALFLQLYTGEAPTKRMLELIQFYRLGVGQFGGIVRWAGADGPAARILNCEAGEKSLRTGRCGAWFRASDPVDAAAFPRLRRRQFGSVRARTTRKPEPRRSVLARRPCQCDREAAHAPARQGDRK
jgi:hypothetical protein